MTIQQTKRAYRLSSTRYRELRHNLREAYVQVDLDGSIVRANGAFTHLVGYSRRELRGMRLHTLTPEKWHALDSAILAEQVIPTGVSEVYDKELLHRNGRVVPVEVRAFRLASDGRPAGIWQLVRDISERRRAAEALKRSEEGLRAAQRLEAVGRLAAGVAHDYNNLLTAILGYADLVSDRLPAGSRARADMEELRSAADRATALTKQLLAFSRQQVLQPVAIDLSTTITNMRKLLGRLVPENVHVVTSLASGLPRVQADPAQIAQIVANLVVNAADAMPNGGEVVISTSRVDLGPDGIRTRLSGSPDQAVVLSIADTGTGIAADVLPFIFEPFFTTRGIGTGSGLGLSAVYGIVKQSGGHISVESQPGCGTAFSAYFPPMHGETIAPSSPSEHRPVAVAGRPTVLLVEDDADVRMLVRRTLERAGHAVLEAANGRDAIDAARRAAGRIDILVTDIVMPGASGVETAAELRRANPGLVVVLMSGYADPAVFDSIPRADLANFVPKPFEPAALLNRINQAYSRRPPSR